MLNTQPRYNALCENKQTRSSHRYANLVLSRYVIISDAIINATKNYNSYISIWYVKLNLPNLLSINVPFVYLLYVPFYVYKWNCVKLFQGKMGSRMRKVQEDLDNDFFSSPWFFVFHVSDSKGKYSRLSSIDLWYHVR